MDGEYKHLLPADQCAYCTPPPAGVLPRGWRTTGGSAYHNDDRCEWLLKGQEHVRRRGGETGDVVPVRWADLGPEKLQPCGHCCTERWLRVRENPNPPAKPCPGRRAVGAGNADLGEAPPRRRFVVGVGALRTLRRGGDGRTHQRDLRPRPA
ncbi:hypothetical protein [Amycolatopsis methanolica]|uniref:hypothetical protein n=1 Tax=Amycolatopsis methanolica TaxID=1814 RepID=UPI000A7C7589